MRLESSMGIFQKVLFATLDLVTAREGEKVVEENCCKSYRSIVVFESIRVHL
jgi:hypothetical protein